MTYTARAHTTQKGDRTKRHAHTEWTVSHGPRGHLHTSTTNHHQPPPTFNAFAKSQIKPRIYIYTLYRKGGGGAVGGWVKKRHTHKTKKGGGPRRTADLSVRFFSRPLPLYKARPNGRLGGGWLYVGEGERRGAEIPARDPETPELPRPPPPPFSLFLFSPHPFFFFLLPFFVGLCAPCDTGGFSWPSSSCTFLLLFSSSSASFPFPLPLPVLRPFSRMLWPWYWRVKRYFFNPPVSKKIVIMLCNLYFVFNNLHVSVYSSRCLIVCGFTG